MHPPLCHISVAKIGTPLFWKLPLAPSFTDIQVYINIILQELNTPSELLYKTSIWLYLSWHSFALWKQLLSLFKDCEMQKKNAIFHFLYFLPPIYEVWSRVGTIRHHSIACFIYQLYLIVIVWLVIGIGSRGVWCMHSKTPLRCRCTRFRFVSSSHDSHLFFSKWINEFRTSFASNNLGIYHFNITLLICLFFYFLCLRQWLRNKIVMSTLNIY